MKVLTKIGIVLGAIVLLGVSFVAYLGGFKSVQVDDVDFPETEIVLFLHKGAYKNIGESWMKFDAAYKEAGGGDCFGLALYFDPPGTPEDQLRSVLGCDLSKVAAEKHGPLKTKFPSFKIPASKSIHSTFPFKNRMSFMVAPMKVYSAMDKVIQEGGMNPSIAIEYYGVYGKAEVIDFYMPKDLKRETFDKVLSLFK